MKIKNKEYKLSKKFKDRWVKALRSGKFKQGYGYLCEFDSNGENPIYCCLGVACVIGGIHPSDIECYTTITDAIGNISKIPKILIDDYNSNPLITKLVNFNDGNIKKNQTPKSFKWIAAWIERNL